MPGSSDSSVSVEPVVGYHREAQAGKAYLLTVDLRRPIGDDAWPYPREEYPVFCMVDASPLFVTKPLGQPAIVLHRFGGSYGPATFLLQAAAEPGKGSIRITLVNDAGVPLQTMELKDVRVVSEPVTEPTAISYVERRQTALASVEVGTSTPGTRPVRFCPS